MGLAQSGNDIHIVLHPFSHEGFTPTQRSALLSPFLLRTGVIFLGGGGMGGRGQERATQREVRFCLLSTAV